MSQIDKDIIKLLREREQLYVRLYKTETELKKIKVELLEAQNALAQPTVAGYPLREIMLAFEVVQESGLEPKELKQLVDNVELAFKIAGEELQRTLNKALTESLERVKANYA